MNESIEYDLSSLIELDVSNGVFTDESIKILPKFKLDNLKIIHLIKNNLHSLNFLENIACSNLEEIWLNNNNIDNLDKIYSLKMFQKLKRIEIEDNKIKDINNVLNLINNNKNLKKLNIKRNNFNIEDILKLKQYDDLPKILKIKY